MEQYCGDLGAFLQINKCAEKMRCSMCFDITNAIMHIHAQGVIHADIALRYYDCFECCFLGKCKVHICNVSETTNRFPVYSKKYLPQSRPG